MSIKAKFTSSSLFSQGYCVKGTNNPERNGAELSLSPSSNINSIPALGTTDFYQQQICLIQGTTQASCLIPGADLKKALGNTAPPLHLWAERARAPERHWRVPISSRQRCNNTEAENETLRTCTHTHRHTGKIALHYAG